MKMTSTLLFAKYAVPCGHKHVAKGALSQNELEYSIRQVSNGVEMPEKSLAVYGTALTRCEQIANKLKMKEINGLVVREYFLRHHNKIIDRMCSSKMIPERFEPERCKVRLGEVLEVYEKTALVEIDSEKGEYRSDFVGGIKPSDRVAVHYDFIVEVLDDDMIKKYFG